MPPPTVDHETRAERFRRARRRLRRPIEHEYEPFGVIARVTWAFFAAISTIIVWMNDGASFTTGIWFLSIVGWGQVVLPFAFQRADELCKRNENLYLGVICGWGLVPGPFVGVFAGILLPLIFDIGLSSFTGGLIGLVVGPWFAIVEGLVIVSTIDVIVWMATGTSMSRKLA